MIIPFKTKIEGFFIKLPIGAFDIQLKENSLKCKVATFGNKEEQLTFKIESNLEKFEILGLVKSLNEYEKEKIVDYYLSVSGDGTKVYERYTLPHIPKYLSVNDSFKSLLESLNILTENPFLPYSNAKDHSTYMSEAKRYFEARERTGNWLCIISKI